MSVGYTKTTELLIDLPTLDSKLPFLIDDFSLSSAIGIRNKVMWYMLTNTNRQYTRHTIPKKSGGKRIIHEPKPLLKYCHTQILRNILMPLQEELGIHVTAYRVGLSVKDAVKQHLVSCPVCNAAPKEQTPKKHTCPRTGTHIQIDLKDFFPTTRTSWIRNYFKSLGYSHSVSGYLGDLLTIRDLPNPDYKKTHDDPKFFSRVPQGSPASGAICNLIADHRLDHRILALLQELNTTYKLSGEYKWVYSRYSDDLSLTCGIPINRNDTDDIIQSIYSVINKSGYRPNKKKTRVSRGYGKRRLLGVVFNSELNVLKSEALKMRAIVHNCHRHGFQSQYSRAGKGSVGELYAWLEGKINWIKQINTVKGDRLLTQLKTAKEFHGGLNGEAPI